MEINSRKLYLSFSVDWEGENFAGIKDLCRSRDQIEKTMRREIPLTHFICPAYYTNGEPRATRRIRSACRPDLDETASHVHCWRSIVEGAGLKFRTDHDWHTGTPRAASGHGVPLGIYGEEIQPILVFTNQLLQHELEVAKITSYRGGGTMTCDAVFDALLELGVKTDSSAFPPSLVSKGYNPKFIGNRLDGHGEDNGLLTTWKLALWGHNAHTEPHLSNRYQQSALEGKSVTCLTQPCFITGASETQLVELPVCGGISDYVDTSKSVWPTFVKLLKHVRAGRGPAFFHFGCHQEGDPKYKRCFVEFFLKLAKSQHHDSELKNQIEFLTVGQSGQLATTMLNQQHEKNTNHQLSNRKHKLFTSR